MSTDWRALAAELAAELERCRPLAEVPDCLARARAVLARFGHQPAPPAEGEVGELVAWLRMQGEAQKPGPNSLLSDRTKDERHAAGTKLTRAADLLERRHPTPVPVDELLAAYRSGAADAAHPTPVPVSERLPGPGDCDALGYCWWWDPFRRESWEYCITGGNPDWYWLPFNALPLPAGKVE